MVPQLKTLAHCLSFQQSASGFLLLLDHRRRYYRQDPSNARANQRLVVRAADRACTYGKPKHKLHGHHIEDLSPLERMTKLEEVQLSGASMVDISRFRQLVRLQSVDLTSAVVRDLSPLSEIYRFMISVRYDVTCSGNLVPRRVQDIWLPCTCRRTARRGSATEEQIAFALRQADSDTPVSEIVRKMGDRCRF